MIIKTIITNERTFTWIIGTTTERLNYSSSLDPADEGKVIWYDTEEDTIYFWDGTNWR